MPTSDEETLKENATVLIAEVERMRFIYTPEPIVDDDPLSAILQKIPFFSKPPIQQ